MWIISHILTNLRAVRMSPCQTFACLPICIRCSIAGCTCAVPDFSQRYLHETWLRDVDICWSALFLKHVFVQRGHNSSSTCISSRTEFSCDKTRIWLYKRCPLKQKMSCLKVKSIVPVQQCIPTSVFNEVNVHLPFFSFGDTIDGIHVANNQTNKKIH